MKAILNHIAEYKMLTRQQAHDVLMGIAQGKYNNSQVAAFLGCYTMRPAMVEELIGFQSALLECCNRIDLSEFDCMDLVGTGGDCKNTFNISTLSTFVLAGAGIKVSKHGNYGVSSGCGSSNVLESLGYKFTADQDELKRQIDKAGICFLHAPLFNPGMKAIAPFRKELGVKTFFNILGPLVNPSFPKNQMSGVFNLETLRLYNYIFQKSGKKFCVLYALDGYDEISLTGGCKLITNEGERVVYPEDMGFRTVKPEEIVGGNTVDEAKEVFLKIISGQGTEAQRSVVLANSAWGIKTFYPELSFEEAKAKAIESLDGGKALEVLKKLVG